MNEEAVAILKAKMSREELVALVKIRFVWSFTLRKFNITILLRDFLWSDSPQGYDYWLAIYLRFTPKELRTKIELNN